VIRLVQGDITEVQADALVTAANAGLQGGGGVDGAIHRACGPRLLEACRALGGCPTGSAVATPAFDLEARGVRRIIHAVGPIYRGTGDEGALLAGAYRTSLQVAGTEACASVAFPAISAGVYGYPLAEAAEVAVQTVGAFMRGEPGPVKQVIFVLFDRQTYQAFEEAVSRTAAG